jgi:hypothetical protein
MRQEQFEVLALVLPCGQGSLLESKGLSVFSTSFPQIAACCASFGFEWQRNFTLHNFTSFRGHSSHSENHGLKRLTRSKKHKSRSGMPWIETI